MKIAEVRKPPLFLFYIIAFIIYNRSFSRRIPSAVQSGCVRRPIGFRPPSDQIPSAIRSDCVRRRWLIIGSTPYRICMLSVCLSNLTLFLPI